MRPLWLRLQCARWVCLARPPATRAPAAPPLVPSRSLWLIWRAPPTCASARWPGAAWCPRGRPPAPPTSARSGEGSGRGGAVPAAPLGAFPLRCTPAVPSLPGPAPLACLCRSRAVHLPSHVPCLCPACASPSPPAAGRCPTPLRLLSTWTPPTACSSQSSAARRCRCGCGRGWEAGRGAARRGGREARGRASPSTLP